MSASRAPAPPKPLQKRPGANRLPNLISLGSGDGDDVVLRSPGVQPGHAFVLRTPAATLLGVGGPQGETWVRGVELHPSQRVVLRPGAVIRQ